MDTSDYKLDLKNKDEAIKDFVNEITILRQLKDSGAKNINGLLEAFSLHSQLWITAEYCPGGSVHTLMRANSKPGLEESYMVPIARELAVALKFVHEAGIIHRDVKCANVLVTEDGQVQLCDFGVSGVLDSDFSKRTTIIGTPFWMAPEMHKDEPTRLAYGTEVDCWAFGCTVYEMATGMPPNARINPHMLGNVLDKAPRLQDGEYSDDLRDFVSFCLQEQPQRRPSAGAILDHPFVAETEEQYPTGSLVELIERYAQWEHQGGQRTSILNPFGAPGPESLSESSELDEWNFSTTADFDKRISKRLSRLQPSLSNASSDSNRSLDELDLEGRPRVGRRRNMANYERAMAQERARRGEAGLGRIFNPNAAPYQYGSDSDSSQPVSDLPLRNLSSDRDQNRTTMIDLDAADVGPGITSVDLADVATLRANRGRSLRDSDDDSDHERNQGTRRATKDWKFPLMSAPATEVRNRRTQDWTFPTMPAPVPKLPDPTISENHDDSNDAFGPFPRRPPLKHAATQPMDSFDDFLYPRGRGADSPNRGSMIDLDFADPEFVPRPSTASSSHSVSTSGNPFEYEDGLQQSGALKTSFSSASISMGDSSTILNPASANRTSFHFKSQSEPQHNVAGLLTPGQRTSGGHAYNHSYDSRSRSTTLSSTGSGDVDPDTYAADGEGEDEGDHELTIRGHRGRYRNRLDDVLNPHLPDYLEGMGDMQGDWVQSDPDFEDVVALFPSYAVNPGDPARMGPDAQGRYEEVATQLRLEEEAKGDGSSGVQREGGETDAQKEYRAFVEDINREVSRNISGILGWAGQARKEEFSQHERRFWDGFRGVGMIYGGPMSWYGDEDVVDSDGMINLDAAG